MKTKTNFLSKQRQQFLEMGAEHIGSSLNTPLREDAFALSNEEKIRIIQEHFAIIMETLGLDLEDDSLKGTPYRVAKMYVEEIFSGLDPKNKPEVSVFENKYEYSEMLIEKNITLHSYCEHHFVPFTGKAHVAYIPNGQVIGLSKLNRLVQYYAARPQVQERLTEQILAGLKEALETQDVAVWVEAEHMCVSTRGVGDSTSSTITSSYSGLFRSDPQLRGEFVSAIQK